MSALDMSEELRDKLEDAIAELVVTGKVKEPLAPRFSLIWQSEMDELTHQLEENGYNIWFTCKVDGVEYRLAARKETRNS